MAKKIEREQRGNLVRKETWAGLRSGDLVAIDADKERRSSYVFVAYVRNVQTGDEWVEVRGGRKGEQKDRSFRTELVYPATSRKGTKLLGPSLVDAPRLQLD